MPITAPHPTRLGPVSAALEAELRRVVIRNGVVVWLDLDNHYASFVDDLITARQRGDLPYDTQAFRGSHLAQMLALEGVASGSESVPLVIHLPGFNEETVRGTPLFELYAAGMRFRKKLDTLITEASGGRVRPAQIAAFKQQPDVTLAHADRWLADLLNTDEGGLDALLRAMAPAAIVDDLLDGGTVAKRIHSPVDQGAVLAHFAACAGLPDSWHDGARSAAPSAPGPGRSAADVAFILASWCLCVEYVDDLQRPPVQGELLEIPSLPKSVIATCCAIASSLRARHADFYRRTADETEARLTDETQVARAEDLGRIDTFRFEDTKLLQAALKALRSGLKDPNSWRKAEAWAQDRTNPSTSTSSIWLRDELTRQQAWQLVHAVACLGQAIHQAGPRLHPAGSPAAFTNLEAAVTAYTARGAAVDQAHRHLEQRCTALLYPRLPQFETIRARLDDVRQHWRSWADAWARDFNAVCLTHGFLPGPDLQQRTLFEQVVRPLTQAPGPTAYFVVDALRYEMAEELYRQLEDTSNTTVQLAARLAELPTVTEVGMNVLAPVSQNGKLRPVLTITPSGIKLEGFSTGEFRVSNPDSRKRAMHDRVGGSPRPWLKLDEVLSRNAASLKRTVAKAKLVVVHSMEIDNAGERGVGPAVFESAMQQLRAAWRLLRDAGVRRFVITSDHGFLLLNDKSRPAQAHGRKIDPKRRHVFSTVAADHAGEVRVPLADLGYTGVDGHLMFPESTAVFDTGRRAMSFVHGGNSLQERVIPVLTLVHHRAAGGRSVQYEIQTEVLEGVAGMHCLKATLRVAAQGGLNFGAAAAVDVALRVPDLAGVQVELCQLRGQAKIAGAAVQAHVGQPFELFFRLIGDSDMRVLVELYHPSGAADVIGHVIDGRFAVTGGRSAPALVNAATPERDQTSADWLAELPEGGVRQVFEHLAAHGTVTESEATAMLGGPRKFRRFARNFESYAIQAPFTVRIAMTADTKLYVREGSTP